jgi:hypothetical protein
MMTGAKDAEHHMAIIAREPESKFTPAPEGLHQAVCVDVHDLGLKTTPWGDKHKVLIVWQLDAIDPETHKRFQVRKQYTLSLSDKANLRKDLECWRGRKFTNDELQGFDVEKLLGANCQLQVAHNLSDDGKVYANVQTLVPYNTKLGPKIAAESYTRLKDKARQMDNGAAGHGSDITDDDIPF